MAMKPFESVAKARAWILKQNGVPMNRDKALDTLSELESLAPPQTTGRVHLYFNNKPGLHDLIEKIGLFYIYDDYETERVREV